jgi:hypothetical protein
LATIDRNVNSRHIDLSPMRLRLSLRLLFIVTTISAMTMYWLFVRPTLLANRFVAAINSRDSEFAKSLLSDNKFWTFDHHTSQSVSIDVIYDDAEVLPREWTDIWACRRRLIMKVAYHQDADFGRLEWTEESVVTAGITGLKETWYSQTGTMTIMPLWPH